jgi:condensin complex subunit 1
MIKTRGQMYEIALCTIDPEPQISSLAKLFFQELAQRNNGLVIYNAMPDMISNLSGGGEGNSSATGGSSSGGMDHLGARSISEDSFRTIVTYLFTFIKRDKQCETLIEKLCQGFRQANASERKCRDLVFCLSKIQLSENGIKKLKETFKSYADKLTIPMVYDTFKQVILKNARKLPTLKNETKLLIDELEKQIDEVKQRGITDEGLNQAAARTDVDMSETESNADEVPASAQTQAAARGGKQAAASASSGRSSSRNVPVVAAKKGGKDVAPPAKGGKKSTGKGVDVSRTRRKVVVESSSDDEDDGEEEEEDDSDSSDSD